MGIEYHYENSFRLSEEQNYTNWIISILKFKNTSSDSLTYIFCDDDFLAKINLEYLNHDTFTDIITFDYSQKESLFGDIFISTERVAENAVNYGVGFEEELLRVMAHGILHLLGYNDKTDEQKAVMREKENELIKLFHVER